METDCGYRHRHLHCRDWSVFGGEVEAGCQRELGAMRELVVLRGRCSMHCVMEALEKELAVEAAGKSASSRDPY